MCGIAGVLNLQPGRRCRDEMIEMVTHMLDDLEHRGPDGDGIVATNDVALGHRRLAIIDLSDAGKQPMHNADKTVWATVNGEIYNYRSLTAELKGAGHSFRSSCDSEVVIHGYQAYGRQMFEKFNGMWGLAIWDDARKELLLSRDRIGVKPLYYLQANDYFIFASEIKALLRFLVRPIRRKDDYLFRILQWHLDDPEETPYEAIRSLPAASVASIRPDGVLKIEPYWTLEPPEHAVRVPERQAVRKFMELFSDAVSLRMISDAPLTYFLSGGLDSAAIVGAATTLAGPGLATISSIFDDKGFDEGAYIRDLIDAHQTRPTIIAPEPNGRLLDLLQGIVRHLDGPSTAQGTFLQWYLFKTAHELGGFKVVLSGNGGDEVQGGYHPYYRTYLNALVRDYHKTKDRKLLLRFIRDAVTLKRRLGRNYVFNYAVFSFEGKSRQRMQRFREWLAKSPKRSAAPKVSFLNDDFVANALQHDVKNPHAEFIEDQTVLGLRQTIMPALLKNEDRMSMAWSVEARHPFLDYRLVEFLNSLDYRLKTKGVSSKHLLRQGFKGVMPRSARKRIDKMGLPTPLARWLRTTERESCTEFLDDAAAQYPDLFDRKGLHELLRLHLAEETDASKQLYIVITSTIWLSQLDALNRQHDFWRERCLVSPAC